MRAPNEDEFRALARSSPWLFTTLHFTRHRHDSTANGGGRTDAWLSRPGRLVVVGEDDRRHVVTGVPYTRAYLTRDGSRQEWTPSPPQRREPVRRPDGLVAERPSSFEVDYDDPMWGSYDWVAMLDPVELSTATHVTDLAETTRRGRRTWWAQVVASDGYRPRCSCCPLLLGEASEQILAEARGPSATGNAPGLRHPDAWLVGLDVVTGVVVSLEPIGGSGPLLSFTVEIHAVDEPMPDFLFEE